MKERAGGVEHAKWKEMETKELAAVKNAMREVQGTDARERKVAQGGVIAEKVADREMLETVEEDIGFKLMSMEELMRANEELKESFMRVCDESDDLKETNRILIEEHKERLRHVEEKWAEKMAAKEREYELRIEELEGVVEEMRGESRKDEVAELKDEVTWITEELKRQRWAMAK